MDGRRRPVCTISSPMNLKAHVSYNTMDDCVTAYMYFSNYGVPCYYIHVAHML